MQVLEVLAIPPWLQDLAAFLAGWTAVALVVVVPLAGWVRGLSRRNAARWPELDEPLRTVTPGPALAAEPLPALRRTA